MADVPLKLCPICNQSLPHGAFNLARGNRDGLYSYCRVCDQARVRRKRAETSPKFARADADRQTAFDEVRPGEDWRDVQGFEGWYQVSSQGRVRSLPRTVNAPNLYGPCSRKYPGRVMKLQQTKFGHLTVPLRRNGQVKLALVHRLVCEAFHGPCPPDKQHCAHRDGDPTNNRTENLRWATVRENSEDTRRHGNLRVGSRSNLARLGEVTVREIRARYDEGGVSAYRLAKEYGTSVGHMSKIVKRENWKHV